LARGATVEGVRQGIAIKAIEHRLVDGPFKQGGQRLLAWCAGNSG
jgi:phage terminase large subunit-like protein